MNVLLVNPWSTRRFESIIIPSMGLGYLAQALRKEGHIVSILDCIKDKIDGYRFKQYIKGGDFGLVGFTMFTSSFSSVKEYAEIVKKNNPDICVVVGGPHPTSEPVETLTLLNCINFAFQGEAERGLCQLVKELSCSNGKIQKEQLENIENLIWRNERNDIVCNPRVFIEDLDKLGYPAWDLIKPQEYPTVPNGLFAKKINIAPIMATRGCPYSCTFCATGKMSGKRIRARSVGNIIEEIKFLMEDFGIREIHILDDNFTQNQELVKDFCKCILENKLNLCWSCPNGVRLDTLNKELLRLMEDAGCYSFGVGIEFGTQRILDCVKKNITLDNIRKKIDLVKSTTKIRMTGRFILGHPAEEIEDIEETINFACSLNLDRANFSNLSIFPGCEIYEKLKEAGEIKNICYDDLSIDKFSYDYTKKIPIKRLRNLQRKAYLKFYLRLKILLGLIKEIKTFSQVKAILRRIFDLFFNVE